MENKFHAEEEEKYISRSENSEAEYLSRKGAKKYKGAKEYISSAQGG